MSERIEALQNRLRAEQVDAFFVTSEVSREYLSGFRAADGWMLITQEEAYLLVDSRYIEAAQNQAKGCKVILFTQMLETLRGLVEKHHIQSMIAEQSRVTVAEWNSLKKAFPSVELIDSPLLDQELNALRAVKTEKEFADLREAQRLTEEAFERMLTFLRPGVTEREEMCIRDRQELIAEQLEDDQELQLNTKPSVILVIGVNGVGKTTTIGKLAARFSAEGKKVVLAAADTFRAAAVEQLKIWADRAGVEMISQAEGSDPAAVVFDAISAAKARGADLVICDTAGRLHNKKNLMDELGKIHRIIDRELPQADQEVLLVLDATTGQNAVNQARAFRETAGLTGIVLTKLDGTAKGGVVLSIKEELGVPVKFIGVGEQVDDLQPFDAREFAAALFSTEE